jgi:hypothetical protein
MPLDYHSRVRTCWACSVLLGVSLAYAPMIRAQEQPPGKTAEPTYTDTFAGPVIELTAAKITVSRTTLGKTEKRTFVMNKETRVEGKLKVKAKVTVGFITTEEGDMARLIVVRTNGAAGKR